MKKSFILGLALFQSTLTSFAGPDRPPTQEEGAQFFSAEMNGAVNLAKQYDGEVPAEVVEERAARATTALLSIMRRGRHSGDLDIIDNDQNPDNR